MANFQHSMYIERLDENGIPYAVERISPSSFPTHGAAEHYGDLFDNKDGIADLKGYVDESTIKLPNPTVPLAFERYSDDPSISVSDYPELKENIEFMSLPNNYIDYPATEAYMLIDDKAGYELADKKYHTAYIKALEAYRARDPVASADSALRIAEVAEAYNVKAVYESRNFEQALAWYNKAVEVAPEMFGDKFQTVIKDDCFGNPYARPYLRAVHGQANTLRKMGRYAEAEVKYKHLFEINGTMFRLMTSYVNWRYHFLEVVMKQGKFKEAMKLAKSMKLRECFEATSCSGQYLWTLALLDYICNKKRGYDDELMQLERSGRKSKDSFESPLYKAITGIPKFLEFLTGRVKLPYCHVSTYIGVSESWTNTAEHAKAFLPLWQKTEGAIEWATRNANTMICQAMLENRNNYLLKFGRKLQNTDADFEMLVKEGLYIDATGLCVNGLQLAHRAMKLYPNRLKILLDAGAKFYPYGINPLNYNVLFDWNPLSTEYLIQYGVDPYKAAMLSMFAKDLLPIREAAIMGHARQMHVIFKLKPPSSEICVRVLEDIITSKIYPCLKGTSRCMCCVMPPKGDTFKHSKFTDFDLCFTSVLMTGYIPNKQFIARMKKKHFNRLELIESLESQMKLTENELHEKFDNRYGELFPVCAVCKATSNIQKCKSCKSVHYCSRDCQASDWKNHKSSCTKKPKDKTPSCSVCGARENLQKCSVCKAVQYCGRKCQKQDWKKHKKSCKPAQELK